MSISCQVNGKSRKCNDGDTLMSLVIALCINIKSIVIEYNCGIVYSEQWDTIILKDGDVIELLQFVGGG